jgi:predicted peroxiredoxin
MAEQGKKQLVVLITKGTDHELSSVAFTIANGGLTAGLDVAIFLTSAGVDLVRKRSADATQAHPLERGNAELLDAAARPLPDSNVNGGPHRQYSRSNCCSRIIHN